MESEEISLYWHNYKFFPYEKRFALREVQSLLAPKLLREFDDRLLISGSQNSDALKKLVYFSHAEIEKKIFRTIQFHCENGSSGVARHKRQNTRYSVHGLHEYKGKFNPQVVRSLFNIYGVKSGDYILDPFCGSGTTLVESAHDHICATGTDINPFAVFIANAKIDALNVSALEINKAKEILLKNYSFVKGSIILDGSDPRIEYLMNWFPQEILIDIEALRISALQLGDATTNIFLVIISNLLRDYSYQEPSDLRIRRRFSPFPENEFMEQLKESIDCFITNLQEFQSSFIRIRSSNKAIIADIKSAKRVKDFSLDNSFDFAITSPPYATALPYIDTQRLSLVWLNLITAKEIRTLESDLIGSRDFKAKI